MARRVLVAAALIATSAACQRNLDIPPPPNTVALSASPGFIALAPRETATIAGVGGAGGYTFAFAEGGRLSGADATVGATTGLYQAGSEGSAVDVVVVTDSSGRTASASISVGPRLVVTPVSPSVTPGGRVTFVGSGGKGPYRYAFTAAGNGSAGTMAEDGTYTAGPTGPSTDQIQVTDAVGAVVTTSVSVGQALRIYRSETRAIAPHESVAFVALGGKPDYTFLLDTPAGSGAGASIDASTGVYTAGDRPGPGDPGTGTVTDVIRVTDSADVSQTATYTVVVGPRLALTLPATEVHPGEATSLEATGGRPPYTFGFTPRTDPTVRDAARVAGGNGGNRSGGTVDAVTGIYRPGPSPGAVDFFQVTDATGAPAAIVQGPRVGGTQLAIGSGTNGCTGMNLDGDASGDVAFFGRASASGQEAAKVITATRLASAAPGLEPYYLTNWVQRVGAYAVGDFAGAGRDRIVGLGGYYWAGTNWANRDVWEIVPDLAGNLSTGQLLGGPTGSINASIGAAWLDSGAVPATWRFYTDGAPSSGCPANAPWVDKSILRFDWAPGTAAPSSPSGLTCMRVQGFCPACTMSASFRAAAFAVGDFGGDASPDLAWITSTDNDGELASGADAKVSVALGDGSSTFLSPTIGWPAGYTYFAPWNEAGQPKFVVARAPEGALTRKDALIVRLLDSEGRPKLFVLRAPPAGTDWGPGFDPNSTGGGVDGVVGLTPNAAAPGTTTSFAAWSATDGTVTGFDLDWTTDPPTLTHARPVASFPFAVNAACFSDVNTDGTPDLVAASDWGATAGIVLGDGASDSSTSSLTWGLRTHQRGIEFPIAAGDLDGDGFGDAVAALPGRGLAVLWGGGGQLAWGPEVTSAAVGAATVGDYTGDGRRSIFYQEKAGGFGLVTFAGGGSDARSAPLTFRGTDPTGLLPPFAYPLIWPADLGTATPGVDALASSTGDGSWVAALLHQSTATPPGRRVVDVRSQSFSFPPRHANRDLWSAAVGAGEPSVAVIASLRRQWNGDPVDAVALYAATISNPDGVPGSATPPAFSAWTQLSPALSTDADGAITPAVPIWAPAGVTRASAALGGTIPAGRPGAGNAVFAIDTDRLYVVEVRLTAAAADSWAHAVYPVTDALGAAVHSSGFIGTLGRLDATSDLHFVMWGSDGVTVLKRTTAAGTPSWTLVQKLSTPLFAIGILPLSDGSPGDVIGFLGNFDGTGVTPELVPLLNQNDGTGRLY